MLIKINKQYEKSPEALKTLIEQVLYLDNSILKCVYSNGCISLDFKIDSTVDKTTLTENITKVSKSILKSYERVEQVILYENEGSGKNKIDPMDQLISSRQVIETYPGVFALQGDILSILNKLDSQFKFYALEKDAVEQHFQPTLPAKSLIENGYLSSFPQHPLFVTNVFRDIDNINGLAQDAKEKSIDSIHKWLDEKLDTHKQILSPTVCYHCFETLKNQKITNDGAIYTSIAPCHRHESRNINGLARLQSFTMREIIFFGNEEMVEENRNDILGHCKSYLNKIGLKFKIVTASDPFFTTGAEAKRIYQSSLALKYEIQAYIPHSDSWISVASFNNHQQSLVLSYKISFESEDDLFSGCVGYGYERLVYALYSQFGCNISNWPTIG